MNSNHFFLFAALVIIGLLISNLRCIRKKKQWIEHDGRKGATPSGHPLVLVELRNGTKEECTLYSSKTTCGNPINWAWNPMKYALSEYDVVRYKFLQSKH